MKNTGFLRGMVKGQQPLANLQKMFLKLLRIFEHRNLKNYKIVDLGKI